MFTDPKVLAAFNAALKTVNDQLTTGLGSSSFQLRVGTPADISECTAIHARIRQKDNVDLGGNSIYESSCKDSNSALLVAVSPDNKVIGAIGIQYKKDHGWHIDIIVSSPDHRNEGPIGTALCCAVLGALQGMKADSVSLQAAVEVHGPKGRTFNQKLFDWYEQKFRFEVNEPMYNVAIEEMHMNYADIYSQYSPTHFDMLNEALKTLNLEPILQEAIQKKVLSAQNKKTESIFPPILKLIEDFKSSHNALPPEKKKTGGRLSMLFSKPAKEQKGASKISAQIEAINKLEEFVLSAQQLPGNTEKLRSDIEKHMKKADPEISQLCQKILDEHLQKPTVTSSITMKGH